MAGVTIAPAGRSGRRPVASRLASLARAVEASRGRRQFDVRQIMLVVGSLLMGLGFVAIVLGWYGAAHSAYLFQEIPYLISGGLLGVALVVGGGFLFFAAWLVRMLEENRRAAARVVQTLDRVDRALMAIATEAAASAALPSRVTNGGEPDPPDRTGAVPPRGGNAGGWA